MDLVSIVIPVFNRKDLVSKSVDSALSQSYSNVEIIIVDNNSTDGTFEYLFQKYGNEPKIRLFKNEKNIGPVKNWIRGIEEAKGKYIKLLFSDDWLDTNYIESVAKFFYKSETIGLFYTPAFIHTNISKKLFYKSYKKEKIVSSNSFISRLLLGYKTPVSPGCAIFYKNLLLESLHIVVDEEKHDLYLKYGAGIDLLCYLNSANKKDKICYVSNTYAHFLSHKGSFTTSDKLRKYYKSAKLYFINNKLNLPKSLFFKFIVFLDIDRIIVQLSNRL